MSAFSGNITQLQSTVANYIALMQSSAAKMQAVNTTDADAQQQWDSISATTKQEIATLREQLNQINAEAKALEATATAEEIAEDRAAVKEAMNRVNAANKEYNDAKSATQSAITATKPESTIKSPEATNPSQTDLESQKKMEKNYEPPKDAAALDTGPADRGEDRGGSAASPTPTTRTVDLASLKKVGNKIAATVPSATPTKPAAATPTFNGQKDRRVRLKVPLDYVNTPFTQGPNKELYEAHGIIFPFTPTISQDYKANYSSVNPTHSNFTQYFYKNSQVGDIALSAKFSVQNETEAAIYLSMVHLLRALTKMKFGGPGGDKDSGAPPPVCRLDAYGQYMLSNVPVAVSSFKLDLPDTVDYFTTGKSITTFGTTTVPVFSTFNITLIPIYSRNEQMKYSVNGWLNAKELRLKGFV